MAWQKDLAAMNEAAAERAALPRAVLEARVDKLERRIAVLESSVRLLAAGIRQLRIENK